MEEKDYLNQVLQQLFDGWYEYSFHFYFITGYFLEPTVFTDVHDEMMIAKEESFGPIMIISVFENG